MRTTCVLTLLLLLTVCSGLDLAAQRTFMGVEASTGSGQALVRNTRATSCSRTIGEVAYIDEGCRNGGLGCNAYGQWNCRFCGFGVYNACPWD